MNLPPSRSSSRPTSRSTFKGDDLRADKRVATEPRAIYPHRPSQYGENRSLKIWTKDDAQQHFFITAPRGLETILSAEISQIAQKTGETLVEINVAEGGVNVVGTLRLAWAINLYTRIGNRVLWKIADGLYRDDKDILTLSSQIAWSSYFHENRTFRVDTVAVFSPLKSIAIASLRAKDGLCDHFRDIYGVRPSVDKSQADVRIRLFLEKLNVTFYLDLSGEALFKRGYRRSLLEPHSAPIRENLAAGLLMLMGWQPDQLLYDPFCGSGTFLIEAARMALRIPSGGARNFAFEKLLSFNAVQWQALRDQALAESLTPQNYIAKTGQPLPRIMGADVSASTLAETRAQLSAWGWQSLITLTSGAFEKLPAPKFVSDEQPLLIANPPYGERMGEVNTLLSEYPVWGSTLKHHYAGWNSAWITGDPAMASGIGLKPKKKIALFNGDIPTQLLIIPLFRGKRDDHLRERASVEAILPTT